VLKTLELDSHVFSGITNVNHQSHVNFSRCLRNIPEGFTLEASGFFKISTFYVREKKKNKKIDGRLTVARANVKSQLDDERILFVLRRDNIRAQESRGFVLITWGSAQFSIVRLRFFRHAVLSRII